MFEKLKSAGWKYPTSGAAASIIGSCFLLFQSSPSAITVMMGIFSALIGAGIACLCIVKKSRSLAFVAKIVAAVLFFAGGVLLMAFNESSFELFTAALCLFFIVSGAFKLHLSARAKILSVDGWWIIAVASTFVIISAFLLARISPESTKGASIWLGITAIADAIISFLAAFWSTKCKTAEKVSIYYEVYKDIESAK